MDQLHTAYQKMDYHSDNPEKVEEAEQLIKELEQEMPWNQLENYM